nr:MAG TPA: hypothetical protein [Caudoviricetes sp.]
MLNLDEINNEILMLETKRDTTYSVIEKLAPLYIVRDHLTGATPVTQPVPLDVNGETDFLQAVSGKDSVQVFTVIDELMSTIQATNYRLYEAVMRKVSNID